MTEARTLQKADGDRWLRRGLLAVAGVGLCGVLYVIGAASTKPDDGLPDPVSQQQLESFARGELAKLETPPVKRPGPVTQLTGPDGQPITLAAYKGEVVVMNLWATWCAPCVTEMPSLARLQASYPKGVRVVPVSVDGPNKVEAAKAFIAQKAAPLGFHHTDNAALAWAVDAKAFPTTVIYDKQGFERARVSRPAEWDAPEVRALLDRLVSDPV